MCLFLKRRMGIGVVERGKVGRGFRSRRRGGRLGREWGGGRERGMVLVARGVKVVVWRVVVGRICGLFGRRFGGGWMFGRCWSCL